MLVFQFTKCPRHLSIVIWQGRRETRWFPTRVYRDNIYSSYSGPRWSRLILVGHSQPQMIPVDSQTYRSQYIVTQINNHNLMYGSSSRFQDTSGKPSNWPSSCDHPHNHSNWHSLLYSSNTYQNHTSLCHLLAMEAQLYNSPTLAPRTSFEKILCISSVHSRARVNKYNTLLKYPVISDLHHFLKADDDIDQHQYNTLLKYPVISDLHHLLKAYRRI